MIIHCYNEKHPYLLFFDLEFNDKELIQFAGLLFTRIDNETYQLKSSYNAYVSASVCYSFTEYTNITNNFLAENGVPLDDVTEYIFNEFLKDVPLQELELISHGLKNDRIILQENGINLSTITAEDGKITPIDGYCTFKNARKILNRNKNLSLEAICNEGGYYLPNAHNAYGDAWATVSAYTYLKKIEKQKEDE